MTDLGKGLSILAATAIIATWVSNQDYQWSLPFLTAANSLKSDNQEQNLPSTREEPLENNLAQKILAGADPTSLLPATAAGPRCYRGNLSWQNQPHEYIGVTASSGEYLRLLSIPYVLMRTEQGLQVQASIPVQVAWLLADIQPDECQTRHD